MFVFDSHGDQQEMRVANAAQKFREDFKPQVVIAGGDIWDFRPWRTKASAAEQGESLEGDFAAGVKLLEWLRPHHLMLGNHDMRMLRVAREGPRGDSRDLARDFIRRMRKTVGGGCVIHEYDKRRPVCLGPLRVVHGFWTGASAAKQHAATYGCCVFGHIHTGEHAIVPAWPKPREAWSAPALCKLAMAYNQATPGTLRYQNGWIYGEYSSRSCHVETAVESGGVIHVATGFKAMAA